MSVPSFDALDAVGRRWRVRPVGADDTVADLAVALGMPAAAPLSINGTAFAGSFPLIDIDALVEGARVGPVDGSIAGESRSRQGSDPWRDRSRSGESALEIATITGPSCRGWTPLLAGRHIVGRAPSAAVRIGDPNVEPHHAVLAVDDKLEELRLTQVAGRTPVRLVGVHTPAATTLTFETRPTSSVASPTAVLIGASTLVFRRAGQADRSSAANFRTGGSVTRSSARPWHRELHRAPLTAPCDGDRPLTLPPPAIPVDGPAATALIGVSVGAVGSLIAAVVLGQLLFALLALIGCVASLATWAVGALGARRRRRRGASAAEAALGVLAEQLRARHRTVTAGHERRYPDIVDTLDELTGGDHRVWSRRADEIGVVLGRGSCASAPTIDPTASGGADAHVSAMIEQWSWLHDVAVPLTLRPGESTAIHGEPALVRALLRSLVVQLATWYGPADLRLVIVTADPSGWAWADWLPHGVSAASVVVGPTELDVLADVGAERADLPDAAQVVIVVDEPSTMSARTGSLRRYMATSKASTLVGVDVGCTVPAVCQRTLVVGSTANADWRHELTDGPEIRGLRIAGIDEPTALDAALTLAPLIDPEGDDSSQRALRTDLTLTELDRLATHGSPEEITRRWVEATTRTSTGAPIGLSIDGTVDVDLVRDGPHALIAGTTGAGKSELLRTLVVSMASRESPEHLTFILVDYKGGSTFDCCVDLPHTVGVVTDLDDGLGERALVSLDAELTRRERALRDAGVSDFAEYRRLPSRPPVARLVVVIDEFATLAQELPEFLAALVGVAQRGRSLGVHLVMATQRPNGVINDDIRANTNLRIALRVNDRRDALDVVADDVPARFSRAQPGRAVIRFGHDELIVFQTARCTAPASQASDVLTAEMVDGGWYVSPTSRPSEADSQLVAAVEAIRRAAEFDGIRMPARPWLDPLPDRLDPDSVGAADAVGQIDDPRRQSRHPLSWDPTLGNLVLVGSLGAGLTSTTLALIAATARTREVKHCHVYVVDAIGDQSFDEVGSIAHCGGVIRLGEDERIDRLLTRLCVEIDRRVLTRSADSAPLTVLFIDGLPELRRSLDSIDRLESLARLDRILDTGAAVGVVCCATSDGGAGAATMSVSDRWVFAVDDVAIARSAGLRGPVVALGRPGRLRIASSGLEAQVALVGDAIASLPRRPDGDGPAPVSVLAEHVAASPLPISWRSDGAGRSSRHLVVGIGSDDLAPHALVVPAGDHIFVGGGGRTGKSTTLDRLGVAWAQVEGPSSVMCWRSVSVDDVRHRLAGSDSATLLTIDDADRVDDVDGVIADILRDPLRRVTVAAAARVESVRSGYGHWTREVTRSRCGLLLTSPGELDGELLGCALPRRSPIPPRPGLVWVVDGSGHRLAQVADRMPP